MMLGMLSMQFEKSALALWDLFTVHTVLHLFCYRRGTPLTHLRLFFLMGHDLLQHAWQGQKFEYALDINNMYPSHRVKRCIALPAPSLFRTRYRFIVFFFCISWSVIQHSNTWRFPLTFLKTSQRIQILPFLCFVFLFSFPLELMMYCLQMMRSIIFLMYLYWS